MLRVLVSGDQHIGIGYSGYRNAGKLAKARLDGLHNVVEYGNSQQCDLLVLTGDLFDRRKVPAAMVKETVRILADFEGTVAVLPGNHDFYDSSISGGCWEQFENAAQGRHNILLLKEDRPYELTAGEEQVVLYPAICHTRQSHENCLGWLREEEMPSDGTFRIGLAHGAVEGETIDTEGKYFPMSREELAAVPADVWLLGHTHVPFPDNLPLDIPETTTERIFNPGTHAQADVANHTEGCVFLLDLEKKDGRTEVKAGRHITGIHRFFKVDVEIGPAETLKDALDRELSQFSDKSVVDLAVSGSVPPEEYTERGKIIEAALSRFADWKYRDSELTERLTRELIGKEFPDTSLAYSLLAELLEGPDPVKAQMMYNLLKQQ